MCAAFGNPVFGNDEYLIGIADRGKTVGDCNGSTVFGELFQALLNPAFAFIVQSAGGFVKNQDRRILLKYAGNRNPLLLSSR